MDVLRSPQLPYQNFVFKQVKLCWKWHTSAVLYSGVICIFLAEKNPTNPKARVQKNL